VPGLQAAQLIEPAVPVKVPASHGEQLGAAAPLYEPAVHGVQTLDPDGA
jgi:hypothetical protein